MEVGEEMYLSEFHKNLTGLRRQWEGFGVLVRVLAQKVANLLCLFPLIHQPLMDNLESQTCEVLEKDIKYSQYQQVQCGSQCQAKGWGDLGEDGIIATGSSLLPLQAIYKCLLDRVPEEERVLTHRECSLPDSQRCACLPLHMQSA